MRSMKLLAAAAVVAALVAGPVMAADDAMSGSMAPAASTDAAKPMTHKKGHKGSGHHKHKKKSEAATPATPATPAQ